jgi:serine/threonine protein kinase
VDKPPSTVRLTPRDWEHLRSLVAGLEEAWRHADSVDLLSLIRSVNGPSRRPFLEELIKTDLEIRYRRGRPRVLEDYLGQFPEMGPAAQLSIDLIYQEYRLRQLLGDHPPLSLYRERFPDQFEHLRQRLITQPFGTLSPGSPPSFTPSVSPVPVEDDDVSFTARTFPPTMPPGAAVPPQQPPSIVKDTGEGTASTIRPPPPPNTPGRSAVDPFAIADKKIGGGYILKKHIGAGQNGEVFLAEAPGGVEVAIKRLFRPLNDEASRRELQALELIRSLRHPYLLTTHAFWVEEDHLHIVMELADESLMDRFQTCRTAGQQGIPPGELLRFFTEAAEALDYLHQRPKPILHRDVKPANLLYMEGHAKVADFGLARLFAENLTTATFCGTPLYMAPEIWREQISVHSDQYSLAAAYAEMCQGKRIYTGTNQAALCQQHMGAPPELVGFNEAEQKVLRRALSKDPNQRFPSCLAFMQALADARTHDKKRDSGGAFPHRLFLLLTVLLVGAGLLVSWLLLRPIPSPVIEKPRQASKPWLPSYFTPTNEEIVQGYYRAICCELPDGVPVDFLLISSNDSALPPFYIMRDKVTKAQFEAALRDPRMLTLLTTRSKGYPWTVQARTMEAARNPLPPQPNPDAQLPRMEVTVTEAHCFAELLGGKRGRLPSDRQWDKAGGRFDHHPLEGPLMKPWNGKDVAVGKLPQPLPVGTSELDVSEFGCRDMAGNGREYTRDIARPQGGQLFAPLNRPNKEAKVIGRGKSFRGNEPFSFKLLEDNDPLSDYPERLDYATPVDNIGFRVVIEPPPLDGK